MVRFRATPLDLLVPTSVEVPVALQLRTGRASLDQRRNVIPAHPAVALHIAVSDVVADALITDRFEQPVKQPRGVATLNGGLNAMFGQVARKLIDQARVA